MRSSDWGVLSSNEVWHEMNLMSQRIERLERENALLHDEIERLKVKRTSRAYYGEGNLNTAEYESLNSDAEKWRQCVVGAPDEERVKQSIKDAALGALVRKMPVHFSLIKSVTGWFVCEGHKMRSSPANNTPEEALRAAGVE